MNLCSGYEFMKIVDVCICENNINDKLRFGINKLYSYNNIDKNELKKAKNIFIKTDYINYFFRKYYRFLSEDVNIITHNSDYEINKIHENILNLPKIKKWYAQNVKFEHLKLNSIPIGIANPQYKHGNKLLLEKIKNNNLIKSNLLYINFNTNTNPGQRNHIYNIFKDLPNDCNKNLTQEEYLKNIAKSKFCISPPGNGTDCHRIWECIYMDTVPIVKKDIAFAQFEDLPILFIDNWEEINNEYLLDKYNKIINERKKDKIYIEYWINQLNLNK